MVVLVASGKVREHVVCLADVVELALGEHTIVRVLLWVPLGSELLIGVFDLFLSGELVETKTGVMVLFLTTLH